MGRFQAWAGFKLGGFQAWGSVKAAYLALPVDVVRFAADALTRAVDMVADEQRDWMMTVERDKSIAETTIGGRASSVQATSLARFLVASRSARDWYYIPLTGSRYLVLGVASISAQLGGPNVSEQRVKRKSRLCAGTYALRNRP